MGIMWFDKPAEEWSHAFPIGNGRLGAMVYGGIEKEILQLNQDSIWYGGPINRINPEAKEHLDEVRDLILKGKIPEAERLLRYTFTGTPQSQRPYQTLGQAEITYRSHRSGAQKYRRELNLDDGMVMETYVQDKVVVRKEYLSSYPAGIIAIHMEAEGGTISADILLTRGRFYDHAGKLDETTIYIDGVLGEGGVSFITAMRAETADGKVKTLGEHLIIEEASELTLYLGCETDFYEKDWKKMVIHRLEQASSEGFCSIKKKHMDDYRSLYNNMSLRLGKEEEDFDIPLDQRMEMGKKGTFDLKFAETYFQYGRYLLISSSREGGLPANLQGIWNDSMEPSWDSKFTININTEMNYWPAEMCGLSKCHLPLFEHLLRMHKRGKETAENMYGCRGFVAHHNTDIWADCAPQDIWIPATWWVLGGAWLCTHIWQHYIYTLDKEFLEKMYPILQDAVLFFHDFLIEVEGELVVCPSVSPENTYILESGVSGCVCEGATMDSQILRDLMEGYLKASEILNVSDEITKKTKDILNKLPEIRIGKHGQIMEWRKDYEEAEPGHRHISHLYALHPSRQITVDKTPVLAEAARKTLERRLQFGGGHTGWSCAWIVNFYTRLGDGENAWDNLQKLWKKSTFLNMMDNHPRDAGYVFQIDGNLGATAGMTEMLVQADEDRVLLLPALPEKWSDGEIKGVRIPGGISMDVLWENGTLKECRIYSDRDHTLTLMYKEMRKEIHLKAGEGKLCSYQ